MRLDVIYSFKCTKPKLNIIRGVLKIWNKLGSKRTMIMTEEADQTF